jgi:hypothetical protein
MQHWFIYYKVDAATEDEVLPRLREMQRAIAARAGVRTRLMRRADGEAGAVTLLEVYDGVDRPDDFDGILDAAVARAGLPPSLVAQRRTERFEAL